MIKKTILLVTAVMIAASSVSYAATKSIKVTNEGDKTYFYKVGNTIKKIAPGSSKSFPLKGLKTVKIQAATSKSGDAIKGNKVVFEKITISEAKANPFVQTNPATGQVTDLSK